MKYLTVYLLVFLTFLFSSCEYIQKRIDIYSIEDMNQEIFTDFQAGNPKELRLFVDSFDLEKDTEPLFLNEIKIRKRKEWSLKAKIKAELIEELITFPSLLSKNIPGDSARFYSYRISDFKGSKTILISSGMSNIFGFFNKYLKSY